MPERTEEQEAAINAVGPLTLVSAGAGSGKTAVLVDRYLRLLETREVSQLVAVTFTEAAAAEMRDRIRKEVSKRENLAHHQESLDQAQIGTIHSLCLSILREHPVEAGIDPGFDVLGEDEAQFEVATVALDAIEFSAAYADRALPLLEIGDFYLRQVVASLLNDRHRAAGAFAAMGETREEWSATASAILDAAARRAMDVHSEDMHGALDHLEALHCFNPSDARYMQMQALHAHLDGRRDMSPMEVLKRLQPVKPIHDSFFESVSLSGGSKSNWAQGEFDTAKELVERLRGIGKAILVMAAVWSDEEELALDVLWQLRMLFEDACERYDARKSALGSLDFLDLELQAVKLLEDYPAVADDYRRTLHEVMVDEFQDTNDLQSRLIDLLVEPATNGDRPSLFVVGDAKQSIYRFRGGDVKQFRRRERELPSPAQRLTCSFRTHDGLVEATNALFTAVFGGPPNDYSAPMQIMSGRPEAGPPWPHLTLLEVPRKDPSGVKIELAEQTRLEATVVAADIARRLEAGDPVWDAEAKSFRSCRAGDIAVLLRRFSKVHAFEQALEAEGVPYVTISGAGFFTRQEVMDLANLTRWLAEPADEIALMGVLRSPMFVVDDEALARLRMESGKHNLWDALLAPPASLRSVMWNRCTFAARTLSHLRETAATRPLDEVLRMAVDDTGFEAAWAAVSGGPQAVANIRKFIDLARVLADRSLDEFVEYVTERREEYPREAQAVTEENDAVRIMTVHGAKGLEFPIVYIPEAHNTPRLGAQAPVTWRAEEGIATKLIKEVGAGSWRQPGLHSVLSFREQEEETAEFWRLFYVGATRASDYLVVSGLDDPVEASWLGSAVRTLDEGAPASVAKRTGATFDPKAARPQPRSLSVIPEPDEEVDVVAPLVERPRVIPVRTSTPVTALRSTETAWRYVGHSDGLGAVRGTAAHRAIELRFGRGEEPDLALLVRQASNGNLPEDVVQSLATEVGAFVEAFASSALAATLRDSLCLFEVPFAFDWDGVPVHGVIDLAYKDERGWHVVDFKSDRVRSVEEAGRPYLSQLALYAIALERATGSVPDAGLYFLRDGQWYRPTAAQLADALANTRKKVDAGGVLEPLVEPISAEEAG